MKQSYKGRFTPQNKSKYVGNVDNIIYRSLLERRFMQYCDRNPNIQYWGSEEIIIPYYNPADKKYHRYFPDFILKTVKGEKFVVEIKPHRKLSPPSIPKRQSQRYLNEAFDYVRNKSKFSAAEKWCEDKGCKFVIMTEKHLNAY
jgi:hypothetical protein